MRQFLAILVSEMQQRIRDLWRGTKVSFSKYCYIHPLEMVFNVLPACCIMFVTYSIFARWFIKRILPEDLLRAICFTVVHNFFPLSEPWVVLACPLLNGPYFDDRLFVGCVQFSLYKCTLVDIISFWDVWIHRICVIATCICPTVAEGAKVTLLGGENISSLSNFWSLNQSAIYLYIFRFKN
jgi:hypothetical protein